MRNTANVVPCPHLCVLLLLPKARSLRPARVLAIPIHSVRSAASPFLHLGSAPLCRWNATVAAGRRYGWTVAALSCRAVQRCVLCCSEAGFRVESRLDLCSDHALQAGKRVNLLKGSMGMR